MALIMLYTLSFGIPYIVQTNFINQIEITAYVI